MHDYIAKLIGPEPRSRRTILEDTLEQTLLAPELALSEAECRQIAERLVAAGWVLRAPKASVIVRYVGGEERGTTGVAPYFEITPSGALLVVGDDAPGDGDLAIAPGSWRDVRREPLWDADDEDPTDKLDQL